MYASMQSLGVSGVGGYGVTVEVNIASGMPGFDIVGLPDAAVKEARERVRAAVKNSGYRFPVSRLVRQLEDMGVLERIEMIHVHENMPVLPDQEEELL